MNATFTETLRLPSDSIVCQFMAKNALERVICFCLCGASEYQQCILRNFLADGLLAVIAQPEDDSTIWIVYPRCDKNDLQEIERVNSYIDVAMGNHNNARVSIVWRCLY